MVSKPGEKPNKKGVADNSKIDFDSLTLTNQETSSTKMHKNES